MINWLNEYSEFSMDRNHALIAAQAKRKTHEQKNLFGNLKSSESFKMIRSKEGLEVEDV